MKEGKKYELVKDDFILYEGRKLYRIRAIEDFVSRGLVIRKVNLGGYVEGYHNLSQEGVCWIYGNAKVYGNARVKDSAFVGGEAEIFGNAVIEERARVCGSSKIYDNAVVKRDSLLIKAIIYGNSVVKDSAKIYEK